MTITCHEHAGFLFAHPCHQPVSGPCAECGRQVCAAHLHTFGSDALCTTCARALLREGEGKRTYGALSEQPVFYARARYPGFGSYEDGAWGHDLLG